MRSSWGLSPEQRAEWVLGGGGARVGSGAGSQRDDQGIGLWEQVASREDQTHKVVAGPEAMEAWEASQEGEVQSVTHF